MSSPSLKLLAPRLPSLRRESRDWMNSQAEACPKAVSRWCAAKRDAARAYWLWNFLYMAQSNTANLAYA